MDAKNASERAEQLRREEEALLTRTRQLIEGLSIPSRPNILMAAVNTQNAFAPDLIQVGDVIRRDVALAARVLHEANTQLPGMERRLSSIQQSVLLLGLERIRDIVTELFLSTALISKDGRLQELRHRSMRAARTTAWMATEAPIQIPAFQTGYLPAIDPEEAYTLGLFHDCGLTILMQKFTDYQTFYDQALQSTQNTLVTEENNRYQTNHCLVGYILGEQWGLPPHLTNVIRTHHDLRNFSAPGQEMPDRTPLALHALLLLSEWVCGEVPNQEWSTMKPTLCTFLGLDESALARLRAAVPSFDD